MSDGNVFDHTDLGEPSHASMPSSEEFATPGRTGNEARAGWRQLPKETEEKVYEGPDAVRDAARDLGRERDASPPEPIERKQHKPFDAEPGAKYATTARQAAEQFSFDHRMEDNVNAAENLGQLQLETDVARHLVAAVNARQITAAEAHEIEKRALAELTGQQQPQQPQPQEPEQALQPEAAEQPTPGISAKLQAALADPEIRTELERPLLEAAHAKQAYVNATAELANAAMASVMANHPELQKFSAHELPIVLNTLAQENPQKYQEITNHLNQAGALVAAHKQAVAQQQQQAQQQFQSWARQQDDQYERSVANEAPEKREAIKREIFEYARENGVSKEQLHALWQSNLVLRSSAVQRMMHDAASFRIAQRNAKADPASRSRVPPVQKPGVAKSRAESDAGEISELRDQLKRSTGTAQIRAAVALHQAQRRARG